MDVYTAVKWRRARRRKTLLVQSNQAKEPPSSSSSDRRRVDGWMALPARSAGFFFFGFLAFWLFPPVVPELTPRASPHELLAPPGMHDEETAAQETFTGRRSAAHRSKDVGDRCQGLAMSGEHCATCPWMVAPFFLFFAPFSSRKLGWNGTETAGTQNNISR